MNNSPSSHPFSLPLGSRGIDSFCGSARGDSRAGVGGFSSHSAESRTFSAGDCAFARRPVPRRDAARQSLFIESRRRPVAPQFSRDGGIAFVRETVGRLGIAGLRAARTLRRPLSFGVRADVCQHRRRGIEKTGGLHRRGTGEVPGSHAVQGIQHELSFGLSGITF